MTKQPESDSDEGSPRQFDVELFIIHQTMTPAEITAGLGLRPCITHSVGAPRKTPKGSPLAGTYKDTRWRYSVRYEVKDQWFADQLNDFVTQLKDRKVFLASLISTGGSACVIIQFLGDGYFGDEIPKETLVALADLDLRLGIEVF